jgi:hypothetical protein
VAGKKNPIHMSTHARLSIVGTNAIHYRTRLTTNLDISTQTTISQGGYSNVIPLFKELSIALYAVSKTYNRVKEQQYATLCDEVCCVFVFL